ncbi:DNA-binding protein, partial [Parabacteroides sp. AF21-43]
MGILRSLQCPSKASYNAYSKGLTIGSVRNRRLSLRPMLINRYSLPRASIGITAPYGGT